MKFVKIIILLPVIILMLYSCSGVRNNILENFAEEQFIQNDLESYVNGLRACGLSDLTAKIGLSYDGYDKKTKTLRCTCVISNFTSDKIDQYYTTNYNTSNANKLAEVLIKLKKLRDDTATNYTYTTKFGEKVIVEIDDGYSSEIHVKTSKGRDYEYSYYTDYDEIMIDGDTVYENEVRNDYQSTYNTDLSNTGTEDVNDDELNICWALARDEVKAHLKSPSSAKFPFSYKNKDVLITKSGDIYTVKAWVEAENSFGVTLKNNFTVTIKKVGSVFTVQSCYIN